MCSCVDGLLICVANLSNAFWMKRYGRFVDCFNLNWMQLDNYESDINNNVNNNNNNTNNNSVCVCMNARNVHIHTSISCVQYYVMCTRCVCAQTNQRLTAKKVKLTHSMVGCLFCCFYLHSFSHSFIRSVIHSCMRSPPSVVSRCSLVWIHKQMPLLGCMIPSHYQPSEK